MPEIIPFVHEGLGNSSYLVQIDVNEALLIDPDRSVKRYLETAAARGWRITHVFETHLHADFVTGSLEIAAALGAKLFAPAGSEARFPHYRVAGGDIVKISGAAVEVIASPGHTPEHASYLLRGVGPAPTLFSGGSLIVGGAARTDLIAADQTAALTRAQFRTLHGAFGALPDETLLYPTHGGGSFCSTGSGRERASTLGRERAANPLLALTDEDEFVRWFPTTFPAVPDYFFRLRAVNQAGPHLRSAIPMPTLLEPSRFAELRGAGVIIDVRSTEAYMAAHIPGSISIPFRDAFATWLGWLVPANAQILLVLGEQPLDRVVDECLLVGYERFAGVLQGDLDLWERAGLPVDSAELVTAKRARQLLQEGAMALDVREPDEFAAGHLPGAAHIPLGKLAGRLGDPMRGQPIVAYCGHGERAATAVSLLERSGFGPLANLDGGIDGWKEAGYTVAG